MHITLNDKGLPQLVDAPADMTLLSCRIEFPVDPVRKQLMGPGVAVIRYAFAGREDDTSVPFKA